MINFLVVSVLISMLVVSFISTLLQFGKYQNNLDAQMMAKIMRLNTMTHLQNDSAWTNTMNDVRNSDLACLRDGTVCASIAKPIQVLKNSYRPD